MKINIRYLSTPTMIIGVTEPHKTIIVLCRLTSQNPTLRHNFCVCVEVNESPLNIDV